MKVVGIFIVIAVLGIITYYILRMRIQKNSNFNQVEEIKRKINELDVDNVETTTQGTGKIVIPDIVDTEETTKKSMQKEDCKEYIVSPNQKIEKTVIKNNNT